MKNIAFTICSNNYLGQAKVLSDSVYEHSRDKYDFYIVLCDVKNEAIDYSEFHANFVEAADLNIENFDWMREHYNIIELNTAIKPFTFKYLINKYNPEFIHYLDPDTCTYAPLTAIEDEMGKDNSILLTPHSLAPLAMDGNRPTDQTFLNAGIYNLGFLGLRADDTSKRMLDWWCEILKEHCLIDTKNGLFVDQLPMNLVPLYFDHVKVTRHKGLNVAYWNLHERVIHKEKEGKFYVNQDPLVFYHFSNFNPSLPDQLTGVGNRYHFSDYPVLKELFDDYINKRNKTNEKLYKTVPCVYIRNRNKMWHRAVRYGLWLLKKWTANLEDRVRK